MRIMLIGSEEVKWRGKKFSQFPLRLFVGFYPMKCLVIRISYFKRIYIQFFGTDFISRILCKLKICFNGNDIFSTINIENSVNINNAPKPASRVIKSSAAIINS